MKTKTNRRFFLGVCAVLLLWVLGGMGVAQRAEEKAIMEIYFIPFGVQTFFPVTMNDIENRSHHSIQVYGNKEFARTVLKLISGEKTVQNINGEAIRMKVVYLKEGTVFYIDAQGIGVTNKGATFSLEKNRLAEIENKLLNLQNVVGIKNIKKFK